VNTKQFTDLKWGTPNPIMLRDPEFGPIRIRAFGNYSMRVIDAAKFIREIVGTDGEFTTDKVTDQLKSIVITRFTDALGECKIPILDLAANYDEMSKLIGDKLKSEFQEYGIDMTKLLVSNISLPPNVEEALDKRSSMGIIGDMSKFTQFQTANAIGDMAKNTGEGGGMMAGGMGMGMGFAMAGQMGNAMNPQNQQQQQQQGAAMPPPVVAFHVVVNGQQAGPFDLGTLQQQIASGQLTPQTMVWKAGLANWIPASQAPELAGLFPQTPPPIAPPPPPVG
jgi:membrane protease subunit (stomatin/prohibitin family)